MQRIVGLDLEARLLNDEIIMIDTLSNQTIVTVDAERHPRAKAQFGSKSRPGTKADAKMIAIVECLAAYPEMQYYL